MKRYWIKTDRGSYWCKSKMKESHLPDKKKYYKNMGYWSDYEDSKKYRVRYMWITAKIHALIIALLCRWIKRIEVEMIK